MSDSGSGIPPPVLERMFDPFFTTKGTGEGTGLGLSLVHGIVADLHGAIDVRTTLGRGTSFTIWLPLAGETAAPSAAVTTELPHGDGHTVMIVDDEKPLVALAEEMLAGLGYEPIGFTSSVAALDAFREAPQRLDIVLTDETMPAFIGTDLAREISLLRPDIPIVLMSGYSGAPLNERARSRGPGSPAQAVAEQGHRGVFRAHIALRRASQAPARVERRSRSDWLSARIRRVAPALRNPSPCRATCRCKSIPSEVGFGRAPLLHNLLRP